MDAISGDEPFMMMADGRAWLFSPSGLLDGPLPTHYEPLESPLENPLYPKIHENPAALRWTRRDNPYAEAEDPEYPHVLTTFRLTEHHTAGAMSRHLPWLAELQPEMFAEIDPELAEQCGIEDGGWLTVSTRRAEIEARAIVTGRIKPLRMGDRTVHQVCMPFHWSYGGPGVTGDAANDLIALSGDPNVAIQESKAFVCSVRPGRSSRGTRPLAGVREPVENVAVDGDHPAEERPEA
jgi:formate dehydrogenase major subunit